MQKADELSKLRKNADCLADKILKVSWEVEPKTKKIAGVGFKKWVKFTNRAVLIVELIDNEKLVFEIPKGFICDSTSLPWAYDNAGNAHDFGYCVQGSAKGYTRKFWDIIFLSLMLDTNMSKFRTKLRYLGVRVFGGIAYSDRKKEKYNHMRMCITNEIINKIGV